MEITRLVQVCGNQAATNVMALPGLIDDGITDNTAVIREAMLAMQAAHPAGRAMDHLKLGDHSPADGLYAAVTAAPPAANPAA